MNNAESRTYRWYRQIIKESGIDNNFKGFEYVMLLPDLFYLLCKLMTDDNVSKKAKLTIGLALAYLAAPINLIPNIVPGMGLIDDVAVCIYAFNKIIVQTDMAVVQQYWCGTDSLLDVITRFLQKSDDLVGSGMIKRIRKMFS